LFYSSFLAALVYPRVRASLVGNILATVLTPNRIGSVGFVASHAIEKLANQGYVSTYEATLFQE
jgi:hypothetical protein